MYRDVASATALAAAGLALAGCGGSKDAAVAGDRAAAADAKAAQVEPADRGLARAALLRPDDLPAGWAADPGSSRERCRAGGTFADTTGTAASEAFTRGNVNIQQTVWMFRDAAAARAAWRAMDASEGRACFRSQIAARVGDQDSEVIQPLASAQRRRPAPGVRRSLLVGRISRVVDGPLGPTQTQMALKVDEIERLHGRGISTVVVVAAAETPDPATVRWLITLAGRRLGASTAAPPAAS
jgi:hypothetical protein